MGKTVLVSGGAGYIGSHVTVELCAAGYDVVVADNMSNCDMSGYDGACAITGRRLPFHKMDFCDAAAVDGLFTEHGIDAVIHFAAFKAVGESVAEPLKYYHNNLLSFMNILRAAREHGGCNVLFSSSATVYGQAEKLPVTEESPRLPATSPYGNTKQICEDILRDCVSAYGSIRGIALRYFNPIGAHPSALIGELPRGGRFAHGFRHSRRHHYGLQRNAFKLPQSLFAGVAASQKNAHEPCSAAVYGDVQVTRAYHYVVLTAAQKGYQLSHFLNALGKHRRLRVVMLNAVLAVQALVYAYRKRNAQSVAVF